MIAGPTGTFTYWDWPTDRAIASHGFQSMDWTVTPQTDPTPDGYFWSHQFWGLNGDAGYAGLQTVGSAPTGKIAIFSVWNALAGEGPEWAEPFTGEGDGFSVRVRFRWEVGQTYPFRVAATDGATWSAWVAGQRIGSIQVAGSWLGLRNASVMWTERYSGGRRHASEIHRAAARFGAPTAGVTDDLGRGRVVAPLGHRNVLAEPPGSPGSSITDIDDGVVQVMGGA